MTKSKSHLVHQFRVSLVGIEPTIWRRIQVPAKYDFWDLHVAIQDAMGWLDYHLHAFRFCPKHRRKPIEIGIPGDEHDDMEVIPGWEIPITGHFAEPGQTMEYEYDFGDSWDHEVLLEAILLKEKGVKYPRCVDGERHCPPEDCGGVPGYYRLLEVLRDRTDPEYEEYVTWVGGEITRYPWRGPEAFDVAEVRFDNPKKRWRWAFVESAEE